MIFDCISQPRLHMCSSSSFCTHPIIRWPFKSVQQNKSSPTEVSFPWCSKSLSSATRQHMQHTIPTQQIAAEWPKPLNHVRSSWGIKCCCSHDFRSMVDNPIITAFALNMHFEIDISENHEPTLKSNCCKVSTQPKQATSSTGIRCIYVTSVNLVNHVETCLNTEWCSTPMNYHSLPYGQNDHPLDFFQGTTRSQESQIVAKILPAHLLLKW